MITLLTSTRYAKLGDVVTTTVAKRAPSVPGTPPVWFRPGAQGTILWIESQVPYQVCTGCTRVHRTRYTVSFAGPSYGPLGRQRSDYQIRLTQCELQKVEVRS